MTRRAGRWTWQRWTRSTCTSTGRRPCGHDPRGQRRPAVRSRGLIPVGVEPVVNDNIASLLEAVADAVTAVDPRSPATVHAGRRSVTWAQFDDRAARLAGFLSGQGIGPGTGSASALHNSPEYLESLFAVLKLRAVPVNVNYRYGATELEQVAPAHPDACGGRRRGHGRGDRCRRGPGARARVLLVGDAADDGFPRYEDAATAPPMARQERSPRRPDPAAHRRDDGLPKGVVWDSGERVRGRLLGLPAGRRAGAPRRRGGRRGRGGAGPARDGAGAPAGVTADARHRLLLQPRRPAARRRVVTLPQRSLDPAALWTAVQQERVEELAIVGDAFAVPLLAELDRAAAAGTPYDLTPLRRIVSSGVRGAPRPSAACWPPGASRCRTPSPPPRAVRSASRSSAAGPGRASLRLHPARQRPGDRPRRRATCGPARARSACCASTGNLPLGYHKDPETTAADLPDDRRRPLLGPRRLRPGRGRRHDHAAGTRLGTCINTGGEKVFPEEVEQVLVEHPGVAEAVVVGRARRPVGEPGGRAGRPGAGGGAGPGRARPTTSAAGWPATSGPASPPGGGDPPHRVREARPALGAGPGPGAGGPPQN